MAESRAMYDEFGNLVAAGAVQDVEEGDAPLRDVPSVEFNVPFPAVGRAFYVRYHSRPAGVPDAWRSMTKTFMDTKPPAWLECESFCPSWWPQECYHSRRLTVNAFVDGTIAPDWDDLGGGSDLAVFIDELGEGVHLYAYVTDLYDAANAAKWVDYDGDMRCGRCRQSGVYVVGSGGRSAFVDSRLERSLSLIMDGDWTSVAGYPNVRFPKMAACSRVGSALSCLYADSSYGMLGRCSRTPAVHAIRTMALSPYHIPIHPVENCFFSLFRECCDGNGSSVGPLYAGQIVATGILDPDERKLCSILGRRWLAARDGHIHIVATKEEATYRADLAGKFGDEAVDN
ncbi:unnamed protein product [Chondrus crispus]|uniref:Uncharacterized protein n=1 Tax=Chondrus crispus TaxID=2769 RepID=R7QSN4_CHOCR|nr:unnamed protein product [Chondrus crispus]CDF40501.1 unnamed protein product [Chondrus crispus]|eukprot:XP_005710795.1 unnamed protein product [Chondrus crispus]